MMKSSSLKFHILCLIILTYDMIIDVGGTTIISSPLDSTTSVTVSSTRTDVTVTHTTKPLTITTKTTTTASSTTTTATTTRIVCNDTVQIKLWNGTCILKSEAQRYTYGVLMSNSGASIEKADALSIYFSSIARPNTGIDGNYVLSPNDINGIVENLVDRNYAINSKASYLVLRSFDGNVRNTNFGASFLHGVGGRMVENISDSQISSMDMSIAGIATNIDSDNIKSLNILIIDGPFTYEHFSTSSNERLASSVVVMTAVQKSAFRSLVPMNIDLYFNDHSQEDSKTVETYKCGYYDTTALAWNELGCSERNFNINSKRYKCSFNHAGTFAFLTFNCDNITHTIHNCNCGLKSEIQVSIVQIDTTTSFLMIQPPKQQNNSNAIVLGASVSENIGAQVVNNLNKNDIIQNPGLLTAAIINEELLNHLTSLNIFIIKDPTPFLHADNSSNKTLASSVVVVSVGQTNNINVVKNINLYFQLFNESERRNDRTYLCSYYNTTTLTWDEAGCSVATYNTNLNRYECSCNHLTSFGLTWLPKQSLTSSAATSSAFSKKILLFGFFVFYVFNANS
ncbi:unnamed protein product [Adineta steineri]|uniref:GAIN-B domain-containing protein n=1 Tax=Adineta steineri TaxID=433720 RepID=A0A819Y3S3_9BILA|nr:unnamed protein product [Adineta steineri]